LEYAPSSCRLMEPESLPEPLKFPAMLKPVVFEAESPPE
jgi:hypothetical protein